MQVAVLDDDETQVELLSRVVASLGYRAWPFCTGAELLAALRRASFDLLLLDWELPGEAGVDVLRAVRARHDVRTPVIFVTHRDDERHVVEALSAGADDYLTKPVRTAELKARILALLRRSYGNEEAERRYGDFILSPARKSARFRDQPVELKPKEFELAWCLFSHHGQIVARAYLMQTLWGRQADVTTRTLDTHVSALRSKLGLRPERGVRLASVYGHGYRLELLGEPATEASAALPA